MAPAASTTCAAEARPVLSLGSLPPAKGGGSPTIACTDGQVLPQIRRATPRGPGPRTAPVVHLTYRSQVLSAGRAGAAYLLTICLQEHQAFANTLLLAFPRRNSSTIPTALWFLPPSRFPMPNKMQVCTVVGLGACHGKGTAMLRAARHTYPQGRPALLTPEKQHQTAPQGHSRPVPGSLYLRAEAAYRPPLREQVWAVPA